MSGRPGSQTVILIHQKVGLTICSYYMVLIIFLLWGLGICAAGINAPVCKSSQVRREDIVNAILPTCNVHVITPENIWSKEMTPTLLEKFLAQWARIVENSAYSEKRRTNGGGKETATFPARL